MLRIQQLISELRMRALASPRRRLKASLLSSGPSHGSQQNVVHRAGSAANTRTLGPNQEQKRQVNGDTLVKSRSPLLLAVAVCVGDRTELGD